MGYNTEFKGVLQFKTKPTKKQLADLSKFFNEDIREHKEWQRPGEALTWVNLMLTDDNAGIQWNGDEKSYDMVKKINLIIDIMREKYPKFGLIGYMLAQGEDIDDRYHIKPANDGIHFINEYLEIDPDDVCICPSCNYKFLRGEQKK